jgi:Tol biopolymer transport system component
LSGLVAGWPFDRLLALCQQRVRDPCCALRDWGEQKQEPERKESEKKLTTRAAAYVVPPARTGERKLDASDFTPRHGELNWSPDGKSIVFTAEAGLLVISLENSTLHRLTEPPPLAQDWGPSFSPDGQKLLFIREHQVGQPDEIMVTSATGGDATRMLSEPGQVEGPPQWSFDGRLDG